MQPSKELIAKLHPSRFSAMSPKMAAIVGYILGQHWTKPGVLSLSITSDGFVVSEGNFFGPAGDLERNWENLLDAAGLTPEERNESEALYASKVEDWRTQGSGHGRCRVGFVGA